MKLTLQVFVREFDNSMKSVTIDIDNIEKMVKSHGHQKNAFWLELTTKKGDEILHCLENTYQNHEAIDTAILYLKMQHWTNLYNKKMHSLPENQKQMFQS